MARTRYSPRGKGLSIDDQQSVGGEGPGVGDTSGWRSVFTIGHSNHSAKKFVGLLKGHRIEVLVDTRSRPYSSHAPHFNTEYLKTTLSGYRIGYLFLGLELGGRPAGEEFYDTQGRVDYVRVERSQPFLDGIYRLEREIINRRVALLCSEEDPAGCHRKLLVGRVLSERGVAVRHIRGDGDVQTDGEAASHQPALFPEVEVRVRKSIRSVLPRRRRPNSSGR